MVSGRDRAGAIVREGLNGRIAPIPHAVAVDPRYDGEHVSDKKTAWKVNSEASALAYNREGRGDAGKV